MAVTRSKPAAPRRGPSHGGAARSGAAADPPKTHQAALVVVPPREQWAPIQAIRERHDRQFRRWMQHLNLIYPFASPTIWHRVLPKAEGVCAAFEPFELRLTEVRYFKHQGGEYTLWLAPEPAAALDQLHRLLARALPHHDDLDRFEGGYRPHLSLGQVARRAGLANVLETLQANWQPCSFRVDQVCLIRRDEPPRDVFRVVHRMPLGGAAQPAAPP